MEKSPVFEKNYQYYLDKISTMNLPEKASMLGAETEGSGLIIPVFGEPVRVSSEGLFDPSGKRPPYFTCIIIFKLLIMCPETLPAETAWTSYKDFKDAAPLISYFSRETDKPLVAHFTGKTGLLRAACGRMNGKAPKDEFAYDVTAVIEALPRAPMLLLFNDADEDFPAQCSVLFERRIETFLDMETVAGLGHLLAQKLIRAA